MPGAAASSTRLRPAATGVYSGSVPGSYELGAANSDSSDPFNDYAIEGDMPYDVGGVALLGYANQPESYGVYGVTFGTNGIGIYGAGDGPTPAPAATPSSTQQSTGVVGDSHSGQGVYGSTEFPNASESLSNPAAGVMGVDGETVVTDNVGVAGETANGDFGTVGIGGDGAVGGAAAVGDTGILGLSFDDGTNASYGAAGGSFAGDYLSIYGQAGTASGSSSLSYPLSLVDSAGSSLFYVDNSGNTYVEGELFLHDGQGTFAKTRNPAVNVEAYVPQSSRPTSEDEGESQLVNGQAYVRLDPAFAQSIDDGSPYMVFVTPEGDTNGVYVTQKSMSGFAVRENRGGRSTVAFSYRIVASQYGMTNRRMALVGADAIEGPQHRLGSSRATTAIARLRAAKIARLMQSIHSRHALQMFRAKPNLAVERRGRL
jgi:hypothetical protein